MNQRQRGSRGAERVRYCERCNRNTAHSSVGIELVEAPTGNPSDTVRELVPYRVLKCDRCWNETRRVLDRWDDPFGRQ